MTTATPCLSQRIIRKTDYIPCPEAFVDTRLHNRDGKLNYCIIGPGVSENPQQHINLIEPHGFNVGGVSLPTGKFNSLHAHETAEVFLVCRGLWRFFWGHDGSDGECILEPGDIISVPVGCFRAFESVGDDDNFMISFLGEDDPGAVAWENAVIEGARDFGFFLTKDSKLIDTKSGEQLPPVEHLVHPLSEDEMLQFNRVNQGEMEARVYNVLKEQGVTGVFQDESMPGGKKVVHPIIGETVASRKGFKSRILNPHSFSLVAITASVDNGFLPHRADRKQVYVVQSGTWQISIRNGDEYIETTISAEDTVSIPAHAERYIKNMGDDDAVLLIASAGNTSPKNTWCY